ncbi:hypothetical protein RBWH47_02239 [Rhodopirellula baltica WH47]|uniref:Uncharacterized protein n=1 Tax=Rhodopirellula baltica WH47 TaxID=991778 RepID=F2AKC0_RHOBT|nr:hypothetical protein RBWH47_02239 [Rhodopirellula baltica WH47]
MLNPEEDRINDVANRVHTVLQSLFSILQKPEYVINELQIRRVLAESLA